MNKRKLTILLSILLTMTLIFVTACSKDDEDYDGAESQQLNIEDDKYMEDDPALNKEVEEAVIVSRTASEDEFVGSWTATSEKAEYLYGNIDLRINDDKTWKGNVTEISLRGKWVPYQEGIRIKDSDGLIDWKLYFTLDNVMLMEDIEDPGNPIVLKKK